VERFDVDDLDEDWPFEIDRQASHLFKHPGLGLDDISDVWTSQPLFYPARPPAHWLMVAEVSGRVLTVPLARPTAATGVDAAPSAAMSPPTTSPAAIGRTDDQNDLRAGERLLRRP
jgi:hypothetical protein